MEQNMMDRAVTSLKGQWLGSDHDVLFENAQANTWVFASADTKNAKLSLIGGLQEFQQSSKRLNIDILMYNRTLVLSHIPVPHSSSHWDRYKVKTNQDIPIALIGSQSGHFDFILPDVAVSQNQQTGKLTCIVPQSGFSVSHRSMDESKIRIYSRKPDFNPISVRNELSKVDLPSHVSVVMTYVPRLAVFDVKLYNKDNNQTLAALNSAQPNPLAELGRKLQALAVSTQVISIEVVNEQKWVDNSDETGIKFDLKSDISASDVQKTVDDLIKSHLNEMLTGMAVELDSEHTPTSEILSEQSVQEHFAMSSEEFLRAVRKARQLGELPSPPSEKLSVKLCINADIWLNDGFKKDLEADFENLFNCHVEKIKLSLGPLASNVNREQCIVPDEGMQLSQEQLAAVVSENIAQNELREYSGFIKAAINSLDLKQSSQTQIFNAVTNVLQEQDHMHSIQRLADSLPSIDATPAALDEHYAQQQSVSPKIKV